MSHQVRFEKTRPGLIPLLEGANGDLVFEERSGFRRGKPVRSGLASSVQEAFGGGGTHLKQVVSAFFGQVQVLMSLQRVNKGGQKRNQAFGANPIGHFPDLEERVLNLRAILGGVWMLDRLRSF